MNVVASDTAPPHFFLVGFRAPPSAPFDAQNPNAQEVGTFIARSRLRFDGTAVEAGDVLTEDEPYDGLPDDGPFRLEAEIAPWKPVPDIVVVDRLENFLTPAQLLDLGPPADTAAIEGHIEAALFGTVAVDRGTGFGGAFAQRFGWLSRRTSPRLDLAGRTGDENDPSSLTGFDASQFDLPDAFSNSFQNGRPFGGSYFNPGDRLRFTDSLGPVTTVTVPSAPVLSVSQDGEPLDPPLALAPAVDTVVMDREAGEVTFTWRATFLWEARFENATLEVG
jgi:hypothetical protein